MSSTTSNPPSAALFCREPPADMPIPNRLNLFLVAIVFGGAIALLWLGSYVESWWATLLVGIVFSYLLLTNYALFHEASHASLHSHGGVMRHADGSFTFDRKPFPGISDDFVREVERLMRPGTSALFILDDAVDMEVILHAIQGLGGTVLKTTPVKVMLSRRLTRSYSNAQKNNLKVKIRSLG